MVVTHVVRSLRRARLRLVRQAAAQTLRVCGAQTASFGLVLGGDTLLRRLNRSYLGHDRPTDVLAFPTRMPPRARTGEGLGDVIISVATARRQAKSAGHSLEAELAVLTVHGILHLLGHDHRTRAQRTRMWKLQTRVLAALGVLPPDSD
ncbi:MAG: rRNA maturation RNase YbeY [Chloroflexi bacterium RBG_16_64_43]|nr:MAG: rRNA maturation RNase YbeY [Chloroflexi bacterium RBG_16_64_43]